ncbi:MAG: InlB B-repeat-containing protein, partial [Clostridia bacterium]|nr:InlB B-repeat-containing protein [Clostridia bacterium]
MRNNLKLVFLAVILVLAAIFAVSCGDKENYTSIETPNIEFKDGAYNITVSSDVSVFDISSLFKISENASFIVSESESFDKTVGFEVTLKDGANKFFVKVTDKNKNEAVYQFIISRKKLCTVKFNTNGGSEIPEIVCEQGQILEAPVSLKPGYTLSWDYDFTTAINSDVTINASWTANKYQISIEGSDTKVEVAFGEKPNLTAPQKLGYKFTGWEYNGNSFDASQNYMIDSDITIKPVYDIQKYTINYITIGGVNTNKTTYTVEDEVTFLPLTWEVGENDTVIHEFAGWYKDAEFTEVFEKIEKGTTGSIDVYAKWNVTSIPEEKIETTITFNAPEFDCNGTTQVVVVGDEYTLPRLEKNGYIFSGWKSEDGSLTVQSSGVWACESESIVLVPMWTKRAYSITYILNNGVNNEQNVDTYYITDAITLLAPTKQYSSFGGWFLDEAFENEITEIIEGAYGDLIVYAKWDEITVEVEFDANGGQISQESQAVVLGGNYTLITPVKLGYKFDGWYDGDNLVNLEGTWEKEEKTVLKAKWSLETYSISYDLGGGTVEGAVDSYTVETETITLPTPTNGERLFLGWSVNNGPITTKMILTKGSVGDRTYVAHWCDEKAENGVVYSISDGVATVVGYKGIIGKNIVIPSEYNGYKVVAIGNNAFSGYGIELEKINSGS